LHYFRDKARYWSKIVIFPTPFVFDAAVIGGGGGRRRNIAMPFGMEKLEWRGYPTVEKFDMFIRFDTTQERDTQTHRRMTADAALDARLASRGKNFRMKSLLIYISL